MLAIDTNILLPVVETPNPDYARGCDEVWNPLA